MNTQYAFLSKEHVPTREQWQTAIKGAGFDLELDRNLKPFESSGYLACILDGQKSGFEIYYDTSSESLSEFADIAPGATCCISFCWGGDMRECASVMIASFVLAKDFGAIVSYEGEEPIEDLESFRADTLGIIADCQKGS